MIADGIGNAVIAEKGNALGRVDRESTRLVNGESGAPRVLVRGRGERVDLERVVVVASVDVHAQCLGHVCVGGGWQLTRLTRVLSLKR
jgi:hypothetical protein